MRNTICVSARNVCFLVFSSFIVVFAHQNERFPPGVNPSRYEGQAQPPPPPSGHVQPPPPSSGHGHPPPPRDHHRQSGHVNRPLEGRQNIGQEREHIKEHMEVPLDTSGMSEQELQFHYFKMHDTDNNNRLDGCELAKSLLHWHDPRNHDPNSDTPLPEARIFTDEELVQLVDPILNSDDRNRDGFIDYAEFVRSQTQGQKT
ncbi:unnamed protein product [Cyprideis torosa]|uniref:EF-hand domain-containing protein n=1 Tax=Cyprideis torosa TaxID=163714 RepID=A0A7R8WF87_9CRUS|nr:unnamed protein product [Cyprideis torosa]CAG0896710.1 unnamed protein product [Cyprideis torosa]